MAGVKMAKTEVFALDQLLAKRLQAGRSYLEFLRVPTMSAGVYVLPAGAPDPQQPHQQDEIYYVVRGKAKVRLVSKEDAKERTEERSVGEGSVIFVEAGMEHRFFDVEEELVVLVVFAPEESGSGLRVESL
jgi:mannose-6-phosphate isomerase-like protein (cupin superfamily)